MLMGGPMMGMAVPNLDVPVIKGTSGHTGLRGKGGQSGTGASLCPLCQMPVCLSHEPPAQSFGKMSRADNFDALEKLHISDCIECGSCAFVCPSKRRQVQQIKVAKVKMRNAQTKANRERSMFS